MSAPTSGGFHDTRPLLASAPKAALTAVRALRGGYLRFAVVLKLLLLWTRSTLRSFVLRLLLESCSGSTAICMASRPACARSERRVSLRRAKGLQKIRLSSDVTNPLSRSWN